MSIISIDRKLKIIPNRLVLTLLEIEIALVFIYGMYDINVAIDKIVGGVVGAIIFAIIMLIGNLISGKESMGFGDIKFIGTLGLCFGTTKIIALSVISFLIGAIISVVFMIFKRKKLNEQIAFGPFIAIAAFILIFIPFDYVLNILLKIFTLGLYKA